jgi:plastocyanin
MLRLRACLPLAFVTLFACQKQSGEPAPSAPPPAAPAAPAATATPGATGNGSIAGSVKLTGTPPEMPLTKRQADPYCAKTPVKEEEVVVGAGGALKNVIVRVKGVAGRYDAPPTPAVVDQSACMYRPRVQGIQLGQPLQIKNSDQTLHNVHGYKGPSTLFNQAEIPGQPPMTKQLTNADEIVKLKCDVHPWMTGYVLVSTNPFFAVTGDDGSFKITGLPAGSYTVEAWHERYGVKTAQVTVAADKPVEAAFQYEAK